MERLMKMKTLLILGLLVAASASAEVATNLTDSYLLHTMLPLAQQFCAKAGMTNFAQIGTSQIKDYRREDFYDRPGCMATLTLTNKFSFWSRTEKDKSEIWVFQQNQQQTYYSLNNAPVGKIKVVQALLKQNKLSLKKALGLARKYFGLLGHDEKDFHPPKILQGYWVSSNPQYASGKLPAYTITWYRKDVTKGQLDPSSGEAMLPEVVIEVSGIDSSLISYSKLFTPVGGDF